jgi:phosphoenolpyruvate carboxykinase (GTP)
MAMLPFCGYNMADYFGHWLEMGRRVKSPPRIFHVNWFRRDASGKFLWPGYGDNVRVLKWMLDRIEGRADADETPIGYVPAPGSLTLEGLNISRETLNELLHVDPVDWATETESSGAFFAKFGDRLPAELRQEHEKLVHATQKAAVVRE